MTGTLPVRLKAGSSCRLRHLFGTCHPLNSILLLASLAMSITSVFGGKSHYGRWVPEKELEMLFHT